MWLFESVKYENQQKKNTTNSKVFLQGENESQVLENVNSFYGSNNVGVSHVQFWFRRYRSGNFDVKKGQIV